MKNKRLISILLLLSIVFTCSAMQSCAKKEQKEKYVAHSFDYFDTATTITGYESSKEAFDTVSAEALAMLEEYHRLFTIYHRFDGMENLCTINELEDGVHRKVTVDSRIIDMLLYAKQMYELSDGRMNVAMGSVLSIWHSYRTAGTDEPLYAQLPPLDKLSQAAEHTDIDNLIIDEAESTVWISDPLMTLDVGAIAKGYAVEMVAKSLEAKGAYGYVINVGGNVRSIGTKPDSEKWLAGIENPNTDAEEPYIVYLQLSGESVVTSGSYQRYYTVDGKNYHHIIDAESLMPAERYLSVSVVCKHSGLGDALSTALFCMPFKEGLELVESLDDVEAFWVMTDESTKQSSGFSRFVSEK